jgi:signal transduction histidine kinase
MAFFGFVVALMFFCHFKKRMNHARRDATAWRTHEAAGDWLADWRHHWAEWNRRWAEQAQRYGDRHAEWHRQWAMRMDRHVERERRRHERRTGRRHGHCEPWEAPVPPQNEEEERLQRARRRAAAEMGFYAHLTAYLGVITLLALINLMTTWYPWFLWPAFGWGFGLGSHWMGVFGSRALKARYFDPAVERELQREKVVMQTEKQASLDELSSTIAHEIRNPIAAAKSLVQQMGEDPHSVENVEYAKVALDELDRVERRIAHLLKFAKEEDYAMAPVNLASVVDAALTQLRGKLDAARVAPVRNYITGPTIVADGEKLKQVFANVLDNAIDAFDGVPENRRVELFIENGGSNATVRVRDNGCGIPPDKLDRIFNPFFTTKEKGTGLGMAISRKIVEAHAGTMDVASEVGRGTEFVVSLPMPPVGR